MKPGVNAWADSKIRDWTCVLKEMGFSEDFFFFFQEIKRELLGELTQIKSSKTQIESSVRIPSKENIDREISRSKTEHKDKEFGTAGSNKHRSSA